MQDPTKNRDQSRVQPRKNVLADANQSFRKRHEIFGYWLLLAVVLFLVIWFLTSSIIGNNNASDAEATTIATLFAPETATATELTETAREP